MTHAQLTPQVEEGSVSGGHWGPQWWLHLVSSAPQQTVAQGLRIVSLPRAQRTAQQTSCMSLVGSRFHSSNLLVSSQPSPLSAGHQGREEAPDLVGAPSTALC